MEKGVKDGKGLRKSNMFSSISPDPEKPVDGVNGEDCSESNSLLPTRKGGTSRKSDNTKRKVQWNDNHGNKLAEILVYEPSDVSDSDDENSDSCICTVM